MLDQIRRLFRMEGQEDMATTPDERAEFILQYGQMDVGVLRLREGVWEFSYTPVFQAQAGKADGVQPLVDFPDPTKVYRSKELWPFFMARIPSISQPQIMERIKRERLDQTSSAQLLKAFGERSIANPFLLHSA